MTKKERAIKKVEIAIDKFIDLQEDLVRDDSTRAQIQRILDTLNTFMNEVYGLDSKKDFFN